jgi:hypothetical protein
MKNKLILDFENQEGVINLLNPILLQSAATKKYVDYEPYTIKNTSYTATINDKNIEVITANTIQTLPSAIGMAGKCFRIINCSNGIIRIHTISSQTIGNNIITNPFYIDLQSEEWLDVISNNSNWRII